MGAGNSTLDETGEFDYGEHYYKTLEDERGGNGISNRAQKDPPSILIKGECSPMYAHNAEFSPPPEPLVDYFNFKGNLVDHDHKAIQKHDFEADETYYTRVQVHFENIFRARENFRMIEEKKNNKHSAPFLITTLNHTGFLCFMNPIFNFFTQLPSVGRYLHLADFENQENGLHYSGGYPLMKSLLDFEEHPKSINVHKMRNVYKNIMYAVKDDIEGRERRNSAKQQDMTEAITHINEAMLRSINEYLTPDPMNMRMEAVDIYMVTATEKEVHQRVVTDVISNAYGIELREFKLLFPQLSKFMTRVTKYFDNPGRAPGAVDMVPKSFLNVIYNIPLFYTCGMEATDYPDSGYINSELLNYYLFDENKETRHDIMDIRSLSDFVCLGIFIFGAPEDDFDYQTNRFKSGFQNLNRFQFPVIDIDHEFKFKARKRDKELPISKAKYTYKLRYVAFRQGNLSKSESGHYISMYRENSLRNEFGVWKIIDDANTYYPSVHGYKHNERGEFENITEYIIYRRLAPKLMIFEKFRIQQDKDDLGDEYFRYQEALVVPYDINTVVKSNSIPFAISKSNQQIYVKKRDDYEDEEDLEETKNIQLLARISKVKIYNPENIKIRIQPMLPHAEKSPHIFFWGLCSILTRGHEDIYWELVNTLKTPEQKVDYGTSFTEFYNKHIFPFLTENAMINKAHTHEMYQFWMCRRCGISFRNDNHQTVSYPSIHIKVGHGMRSENRFINLSGLLSKKAAHTIDNESEDYRKMGFQNHPHRTMIDEQCNGNMILQEYPNLQGQKDCLLITIDHINPMEGLIIDLENPVKFYTGYGSKSKGYFAPRWVLYETPPNINEILRQLDPSKIYNIKDRFLLVYKKTNTTDWHMIALNQEKTGIEDFTAEDYFKSRMTSMSTDAESYYNGFVRFLSDYAFLNPVAVMYYRISN